MGGPEMLGLATQPTAIKSSGVRRGKRDKTSMHNISSFIET
jgi:hypothetical protein